LYGPRGGGISERDGLMPTASTLIEGTLGKAYGVHGRLHHRLEALCDFVRSFSSGFIFTTALPPAVAAAARASIRHLKESRRRAPAAAPPGGAAARRLDAHGIPHLPNPSHIIPVMVKDPVKCRQISDVLMDDYGIYVQPINYPTVPKGTERLRITPSPAAHRRGYRPSGHGAQRRSGRMPMRGCGSGMPTGRRPGPAAMPPAASPAI
jgi:5-aminolevulinate synthase